MRFPGKSKEHTTKEETAKNYLEQSYCFRAGNISASFWQGDDKHPLPTFFHRFSTIFKFALTCHPTFLQGTAPPKVIEFMNQVTLVSHLRMTHL